MRVLTINTYAGSLLLGAKATGLPAYASYEDVGYGVEVQRANFPDLEIVPRKEAWPKQDLRDVIVIAHPPCAAFSQQNNRVDTKGLDAPKFQCTKNVLDYALGNHARGVLVESVVGALDGAWELHGGFARTYGYRLFRILQNAGSFGVAQNRPRFWAVYLREDWAPKVWHVRHQPVFKTIGEVCRHPGPAFSAIQRLYDFEVRKMLERGMKKKDLDQLLQGEEPGNLISLYHRFIEPQLSREEVCLKFFAGWFQSKTIRVLAAEGQATTLLGDALWVYRGRLLSAKEYRLIMGFPGDYVFPGKHEKNATFFLSQGVVPAVAAWLLGEVLALSQKKRWKAGDPHVHAVGDGAVLNLRPELGQAPWAMAPKDPLPAPGTRPTAPGRGTTYRYARAVPARYEGTQKELVVKFLRSHPAGATAREIGDNFLRTSCLITRDGTVATSKRVREFVGWAVGELKRDGVITAPETKRRP